MAARSNPKNSIVLAILFIIYVFNTMDRQIISVLAEVIKKDLSLSDTEIGLVSGLVFAVFYSVCSIPLAWLSDRYGRVITIALSCTLWSIGSALGGVATNFAHLALARIGVGIGEAGGTAPSHSLIGLIFPPQERAKAFGIFSMGGPAGGFLAIMLCGAIASRYGWRVAIVTVSLPGVLFALLLYLIVPEPRRTADEAARPPSFGPAIRSFFTSPILRAVSLASAASAMVVYGLTAWLPAYLMRAKGMSLGDLAVYYSIATMAATAVGLYLGGRFADRLARRHAGAYCLLPAAGLLLGTPLVILGVFAADWMASLAAMAIALLFTSIYLGPMIATVQGEARDEQRSVFAALFMMLVNLIGAGVGPLLVGVVSDALLPRYGDDSLSYGLLTMVPIMLTAAYLHWRSATILAARAAAPGPAIAALQA